MALCKVTMTGYEAQGGTRHNEPLGYYNLDVANFTTASSEMATAIDAIGRAFIANTTNSYSDTTVELVLSANEILAE